MLPRKSQAFVTLNSLQLKYSLYEFDLQVEMYQIFYRSVFQLLVSEMGDEVAFNAQNFAHINYSSDKVLPGETFKAAK